jgi:histidinol dehydrogenase
MAEYHDMIEWLVLLNKNPQLQPQEDTIKPILNAFKLIGTVAANIDKAETNLKQYRTDIENALMDQTKRFNSSLEQAKHQVNNFKTYQQSKQAEQYISEIEECLK